MNKLKLRSSVSVVDIGNGMLEFFKTRSPAKKCQQ